jgi:hypothetical protein
MLQWRDYSPELALDEMLRLDGWGAYSGSPCGECLAPRPQYRCMDCFGGELLCLKCILSMHQHSPFHIIEVCFFIHSFMPLYSSFWVF